MLCRFAGTVAATALIGSAVAAQPESRTAQEGDTVTFRVEAEGEGLAWQWEASPNGTVWFPSTVTGADTGEITVEARADLDGYRYRCVITDAAGQSVETKPATLTVIPRAAPGPSAGPAPEETEAWTETIS